MEMDVATDDFHDGYSLCICVFSLSNFKLMIQDILVYILVIAAVAFFVKKYFFKKKNKGCGNGTGCQCK